MELLSPDEALRIIEDSVQPLAPRKTWLDDACGLVLAEDVSAACDLPPFDNSAMDGYAVRSADLKGAGAAAPAGLRLAGALRAGQASLAAVQPGETIKIMTGAPLPEGADAVVPVEQAEEMYGSVKIASEPEPGQHVRRRGLDVLAGAPLLKAGCRLRPYEIALLASQGIGSVKAVPAPRVAVAVSGDELVDFRNRPAAGQIRDANGPALRALLRGWGFTAIDGGSAKDDPKAMAETFNAALCSGDALLVSGGVSVGDHDHTRGVLEDLGLKTLFWRVAIKPGKPLLFGLCRGKPVFGLPGNPISSLVCAEVFVRPALERLAGRVSEPPFPLRGKISALYQKPERLRQFIFCSAKSEKDGYRLEVLEPQGSGLIGMGSRANALAVGPIGVSRLEPGLEVRFRWL